MSAKELFKVSNISNYEKPSTNFEGEPAVIVQPVIPEDLEDIYKNPIFAKKSESQSNEIPPYEIISLIGESIKEARKAFLNKTV
jgi:hypothetical protein